MNVLISLLLTFHQEFEGSAIKQSNKAKEIKRQRGKKQNLLSPDQQTSRQPASHTLARSALEEPRAYNIHNDTSVYTRLLGGRDQAKSRPSNPQRLQAALHLMTPTILYVQYSCIEGCRSQGTCVHFSFLVHGRALPDGLICQMCQAGDCEEGHEVNRMCVRHKQSVDTQTITNHREDVLATPHEMLAAMERFRRAWICDWDSTDPDSHAIATIDTVKPCSYYNTAAFQTDIHPTTATKTYIPDPRPQKRLKVSDYVHDTPKWLEDRLPASETFQPARLSSKFVAGTQNDQKTDNKPHSESIEQELDQRRFTFGAMDQTMFHSTDGPSLEWLLMQPLNV